MSGQIVAVTSSGRSTGKSVVAANLAFELARNKSSVLLIDGDHSQPSQHLYFSLSNAPTGISAACRLIQTQKFAERDWRGLCVELVAADSTIMFMGGVSNALMAQHIDSMSMQTLLEFFKMQFDYVVVDLAAVSNSASHDSAELSAIQESTLRLADLAMVVESSEPIAIHRLIASEAQLSASVNYEQAMLVMNRVRSSALGKNPKWQIENTLATRFSLPVDHYISEDSHAFDAAMLRSIPLRQAAKRSNATDDLEDLCDLVRAKLKTQKVVPLLTPVSVRSDTFSEAATPEPTPFNLSSRLFG